MQKPEMCGAVIFVNVNQSGKPAAPGFGKRQDRFSPELVEKLLKEAK